MDLKELRTQINGIDEQILELFVKRMDVCCNVAQYKIENDLPVFQASREQEIIDKITDRVRDDLKGPAKVLFTDLMDISKCRQFQTFFAGADGFPSEPLTLVGNRTVAIPGTSGSYSHAAAMKFFPEPVPLFYESFGEVFAAVESSTAEFGVVPICNSTTGTVSQTYELMNKHDFKICACTKIPVNHCLAAREDTDPSRIREIYSHEQAIMQCSSFLAERGYKTHTYENTATAAVYVKESDRPLAAICSEICANELGLKIIDRNISDTKSNTTRFILITRKTMLIDGANIISVSLTTPHEASALYRLLTKFSVSGLNLTKLESRPIANTDFDVMFYLNFEGSIRSPEVIKLMRELETELSYFKFLGNYKEI